jgi:hypothetical protein
VSKLLAVLMLATVPGVVFAEAPSEGVPLQVRRGVFTETDIGGFMTLGGQNQYSYLQSYLQLGLGYQLTIGDGKGLVPIGLHVAIGGNDQNCFADLNPDGTCSEADNFTLTFLGLSAGYLHQIVERVYLGGKAVVGYTLLDPAPLFTGADASRTPVKSGLNVGAALSLEYATNMDHFSVGLDVMWRMVLGPNIMSLSFFPRVQYTF